MLGSWVGVDVAVVMNELVMVLVVKMMVVTGMVVGIMFAVKVMSNIHFSILQRNYATQMHALICILLGGPGSG